MNLNDREWKEFKINNLFNVMGTVTTKPEKLLVGGMVPRITCASTNNGLDDFFYNAPTEKAGVVTIDSATVGYVAYQGYDFIATDHVEKLVHKNKRLNLFVGLFIKQVIDTSTKGKYNYGYKFSQSRIKQQKILLPIDSAGNPDYEFMEQYIKQIIANKHDEYRRFLNKQTNIKALPSKKWGSFFISGDNGVFTLRASNSGIDKNKLCLNDTRKTPYITRSDLNNGISLFVGSEQKQKYKKDSGNVITVGLDTQTAFYQPHEFFTGQNIQVLGSEKLNKYNALFLATALKSQLKKFNWGGNGATLGRLKRTKILLPVTDASTPDYDYMAQYIKNIMCEKHSAYLQYLDNI